MGHRSTLLACGLVLVACGGVPGHAATDAIVSFDAPHRAVEPGEVERAITFTCEFDRFRFEDPIAHPGHVMGTHLHQFFGARGVHTESAADELIDGETTCDDPVDTAAYWAPSLMDPTGMPIEPVRATVTYRAGPDVDAATVAPFPDGFMTVAGSESAEDAQPTTLVSWSCAEHGRRTALPTDCESAPLRMNVTFQDCWDGRNNRSPIVLQPNRHVAYSDGGSCPDGHPVHIPQVEIAIEYPTLAAGDADQVSLSSGEIVTGHAYYWHAWRSDASAMVLMPCLLEGVGCDEEVANASAP